MASSTTTADGITPSFHLYTYFRSSCSARLRIALALKSITYTRTNINLLAKEHLEPSYAAINPSRSVPTLVVTYPNANGTPETVTLTQSLATLNYLDEAFPNTVPILPSSPKARALSRTLAEIIAEDIQPATNLRIQLRIKNLADQEASVAYTKEVMTEGFRAFEAVLRKEGNADDKYCVGNQVSLADLCLVPAVWGAMRWGVELAQFERLMAIYDRLSQTEEVKKAHWSMQPDTPEELRGEGWGK